MIIAIHKYEINCRAEPFGKRNDGAEPSETSETSEPEAPEWDGEGEYPPVGCICLKGCKKVRILAHTNVGSPYDPAVVWQGVDEPGDIDWAVCNVFAPLRTPAQRAEDDAIEDMKDVLDDNGINTDGVRLLCEALYRAGYRKKEGEL